MQNLKVLLKSKGFQYFIIAVIIINGVVLGMQTSPRLMANMGGLLNAIDNIALIIFIIEIALKLIAFRLDFFKSGWNWFDFIIVGIAVAPVGQGFGVLRALRILRVLRLISVVPSMRHIVQAFLKSLPGMGSVVALLGLIFYVAAVMTTNLYGAAVPEKFGNLPASLMSLFEVMTMEGWKDNVVDPVMEHSPYAWAFFIPFMIVTGLAVLNLFIGIIVGAMEEEAKADQKDVMTDIQSRLQNIEDLLNKRS